MLEQHNLKAEFPLISTFVPFLFNFLPIFLLNPKNHTALRRVGVIRPVGAAVGQRTFWRRCDSDPQANRR